MNPPSEVFATAGEAKRREDELRAAGASFKTSIVKTRKRGLEYRIQRLDVTDH